MLIAKQGGLTLLFDLIKKNNISNRLKCEIYYTLSMICLNNAKNSEVLFEIIGMKKIINDCRELWFSSARFQAVDNSASSKKNYRISDEEVEEITVQIIAGLAICGFGYRNDEFMKMMLSKCETFEWEVISQLFMRQNVLLEKASFNNDRKRYFIIQKMRCLLCFQIAALHSFVNKSQVDPRAIAIKFMVDALPTTQSGYLRSVICDYIGRLVCTNDSLYEPFICIDAIEILCKSTYNDSNTTQGDTRGNTEICCASITLGILLVNRLFDC